MFITSYGSGPLDGEGGAIPTVYGNEIETILLAVGGVGIVTGVGFGDAVRYVNLLPSTDCHVAIGAAVTAASPKNAAPFTRKLKANRDYMFAVRPGDKIAVIAAL